MNAAHLGRYRSSSLGCTIVLLAFANFARAQCDELVFREDFEHGWNGWTNDTTYNTDKRFAWLVIAPTNGPAAAHAGTNCAGTVNPGNDCYLVSPPIILPETDQYSNHLWLFYWQWQKYQSNLWDTCLSDVKIRQLIPGPIGNYWGPWNIIDPGTSGVIPGYSPMWRRRGIDLSLFRGNAVQLGFGHYGVANPGWFVDDVEIWNVPVLTNWATENFENGWGAWHTDEGVWDIGVPSSNGPTNLPSGTHCAGTGLDGAIPTVFESHLWTPAFYLSKLNPGEGAYLQFEQWQDYGTPFGIAVQWSQWWPGIGWTWPQIFEPDPLIPPPRRTWATITMDVTRLAGAPLPMRLGFEHMDVSASGLGWFIDDVRITVAQFRVVDVQHEGNNLRVSWTSPAGTTNVLQCTGNLGGAFTNVSPPLIATGTAEAVTSYVHVGVRDGASPCFYRIKRLP
jgi:hypothetical protein